MILVNNRDKLPWQPELTITKLLALCRYTSPHIHVFVNDELGEVDRGLEGAEKLLAPGGRLAVVSFHSLEDKRVKAFLNERSGNLPNPSRYMPDSGERGPAPTFELLKKGAIKPGRDECRVNPRARSSRLRAARRTDAPAWGEGRAA